MRTLVVEFIPHTSRNNIKPGLADKVTKHVLTVFTQEDFLNYQEANRGITDHRAVFDQLDYMLDQRKALTKYKELAEEDAAAAELLRKAQWTGITIDAQLAAPMSPTGDSAVETVEGIPEMVYWSDTYDAFYSAHDFKQLGAEFTAKWYARRSEFPYNAGDAELRKDASKVEHHAV